MHTNNYYYYWFHIALQNRMGPMWLSGKCRGLQIVCHSRLWVRIPSKTVHNFLWWSWQDILRNVGSSTKVPACSCLKLCTKGQQRFSYTSYLQSPSHYPYIFSILPKSNKTHKITNRWFYHMHYRWSLFKKTHTKIHSLSFQIIKM
jgi:hypothetical protein